MLVELANEFPNCGYVKEETDARDRADGGVGETSSGRSRRSSAARPGRACCTRCAWASTAPCPGAPYSDIYAQIWNLYQAGKRTQARELFGRLLVLINMESQIPGTRQYIMKKRGVFKTTVSRQKSVELSREAMAEIDFNFEALKAALGR